MPGTKDEKAPSQWFKKSFGFREDDDFETTQRKFTFDPEKHILDVAASEVTTGPAHDRRFYVGPFETISLEDLRARLANHEGLNKTVKDARPLTFHNISGTTLELHLASENAGAIFQVASLFNCLE